MKDDVYYTVQEVSLMLRVSKPYIYEAIATKRLNAIKLSPRRTRITKIALEEFIKEGFDSAIENKYNAQPPKRGRKRNHGIN